MFLLPKRSWRLTAFTAIILAACSTAGSQTQTKPGPSGSQGTAEGVAASMWRTISTVCRAPGSTSPSTFLRSYSMIVEYRNARTSFYPWRVSKADELNGITFKGLAVLRADAERITEKGSAWEPWEAENIPNMDRKFWDEFASDGQPKDFTPYWPSIWVVVVEKRGGQWYFTSSNFRTSGRTLDQNSLPDTATKQPCAELTSASPFGGQSSDDTNKPRVITLPGVKK